MSKMEYSYRIMAQIYISTNFFYLFTIRNLFFKAEFNLQMQQNSD